MDQAPSRRRWAVPLGIGTAVVAGFALVGGCALVASRVIDRAVESAVEPLTSSACRDSDVELIRHAEAGAEERVREALDDGQDPDAHDRAGNTALACAGPAGHPGVVEVLLDAGADPDTVARDDDTVVADAVRFCRDEVLALLLDAGADPDRAGPTAANGPLAQAVAAGRAEAATLLIGAGADADAIETPTVDLFGESTSPCPEPTQDDRAGALTAVLDAEGDPGPVLAVAATHGIDSVAADALGRGADPNRLTTHRPPSPRTLTAAAACLTGSVDPGPATTGPTPTGPTSEPPPVVPDECPVIDGVNALVEPRPPLADGDDRATTPLVLAAWAGRADLVERLLDAGADPAIVGPNGVTPLHAAAGAGAEDVVAVLLPRISLSLPGELDPPSTIADAAGHTALAASLRDAGL